MNLESILPREETDLQGKIVSPLVTLSNLQLERGIHSARNLHAVPGGIDSNAFNDSNFHRTKGAEHASPGQRPGYVYLIESRALKGRHNRLSAALVRPFRANDFFESNHPRRCPGLACFRPLALKNYDFPQSQSLQELESIPRSRSLSHPLPEPCSN